jgi:hypothetical protein
MRAQSFRHGLSLVGLAFLAGCELPVGTFRLSDGIEISVKATKIGYMPIPYAEGGHNYHFIGIGWLDHLENFDRWCLKQYGQVLGVYDRRSRGPWVLTPEADAEKVQKGGWSFSQYSIYQLVVGATKADGPRKGDPVEIGLDNRAPYFHSWTVYRTPALIMDPSWDTVVFVCDILNWEYDRIVVFDSSHYEFLKSDVTYDQDKGGSVQFRLRNRRTQEEVVGKYEYIGWKYSNSFLGPAQVEILSGDKGVQPFRR